ncbi:MAG: TadE/TadG family type IV pilus assembly protein [Vicinamibacterales bacterium]
MSKRFMKNQRGSALIETAITIPIVLLVSVAIFEFGRAYQTWQVLTNAAREGARVAVIQGMTDQRVQDTVRTYLTSGRITNPGSAAVNINRNVPINGGDTASSVTISYPFNFIVLNPVARLVVSGTNTGSAPVTMQSVATMRNES